MRLGRQTDRQTDGQTDRQTDKEMESIMRIAFAFASSALIRNTMIDNVTL